MTSYKAHRNIRYYKNPTCRHIVISDLINLTGDLAPMFVSEQEIIEFIDKRKETEL